jgi:hypothetical protein
MMLDPEDDSCVTTVNPEDDGSVMMVSQKTMAVL